MIMDMAMSNKKSSNMGKRWGKERVNSMYSLIWRVRISKDSKVISRSMSRWDIFTKNGSRRMWLEINLKKWVIES